MASHCSSCWRAGWIEITRRFRVSVELLRALATYWLDIDYDLSQPL